MSTMIRHPNRLSVTEAREGRSGVDPSRRNRPDPRAARARREADEAALAAPRVVVQWIETQWTKKSRGAPGAVLRYATPRAVRMPAFGAELTRGQGSRYASRPQEARWLPFEADGDIPALRPRASARFRRRQTWLPVHMLTYREEAEFEPVESLTWVPRDVLEVTVEPLGQEAGVEAHTATANPGPRAANELRIHYSRLIHRGLRLGLGETARFERNYRTSGGCCCRGEWRYFLDVVNVYYGPCREDVFLAQPDHVYRNLDSMR